VDNEETFPLSIGIIVGGPTKSNEAWKVALMRLMNQVILARQDIESPLNVNVVFQVPGSILTPDFEGARTGSFSKARRLLMVQVALPAEMPTDPDSYLRDCLAIAVSEVEKWNARPGRGFALDSLHEVLSRL
jgi:hypothetical protein